MNIEFYKYQGTGNDFVIIDNRNNALQLTTEQVHFLCDRRFGVGADGLMLLQSAAGYDFEMIYYNADGNLGSMCGNGGRCLVQFAHDRGIITSKYHFIASDGPHDAEINTNGWVHLKMKDVQRITQVGDDFDLNTGSPHYIRVVDHVQEIDAVEAGRKIRYNTTYKQVGINVNFVQQINKDTIAVRTYERGVEDETLSCGTGVTASALVFAHNDRGFNRVEVQTKGGHLAVEFNKISDEQFDQIWLCGPATFVYKGHITI